MKVLSKHEFSSFFTPFKILLMLKYFMFYKILNFLSCNIFSQSKRSVFVSMNKQGQQLIDKPYSCVTRGQKMFDSTATKNFKLTFFSKKSRVGWSQTKEKDVDASRCYCVLKANTQVVVCMWPVRPVLLGWLGWRGLAGQALVEPRCRFSVIFLKTKTKKTSSAQVSQY